MRLCNSSHGSSGRNGNGQIRRRSTALGNTDEVDPMQIDLTKLIRCRLVVVVVVVVVVAELPGKPVCFTQVKVTGVSPAHFTQVKIPGREFSRGSIRG